MSTRSAEAPHAAARRTALSAARNDHLDSIRAIGILLVMVGHLPGLPDWLGLLIYAFHVPLFFWVSGWMIDPQRLRGPLGPAVAGVVRRLGVPYVVFFAVSWLYWMATRGIGDRAAEFAGVSWHEPWVGFLFGVGPAMVVNPTLWFFPCLLATTVVFLGMHRLATRWHAGTGLAASLAIAAFGFAMLATAPHFEGRWPWGLDILPAALVFLSLGQACRVAWPRLLPLLNAGGLTASIAWSAILVAAAWGAVRSEPVDMQHLLFGTSPLAFVAMAMAGVAISARCAARLPGLAPVRWLGRNTLILFPTHVLIYNFLSGVGKLGLGLSAEAMRTPAAEVAIVAVTLLLSVPVVAATRRLLDRIDRRLPRP